MHILNGRTKILGRLRWKLSIKHGHVPLAAEPFRVVPLGGFRKRLDAMHRFRRGRCVCYVRMRLRERCTGPITA
jgi:hypothetical protein